MGEKRSQPFHGSLNPSLKGARAAVLILMAFTALYFSLPLLAQQDGPMPGAPSQREFPASATQATSSQAAPQTPATPQDSKQSSPSSPGISKEQPAVPVDQIIQKFAEREAEFREERDNFTYVQDFTVQTIDGAGEVDGEFRMTSDITYPAGKRYENITYAPPSTLEKIMLSEQDFDDLKNVQPFVLTTEDMPKYDVSYVGREKLDEIGTYVFDVAPKKIEKNQRYFQGRIWVDDRDLEIVKTYGKAVPDIHKGDNENVFPRFETYRENIEGKYWFPTYTHADDFLHFRTGDVHIRMTIHYSDYKRFRSSIRLLKTTPINP
jgi:hypothetical protein